MFGNEQGRDDNNEAPERKWHTIDARHCVRRVHHSGVKLLHRRWWDVYRVMLTAFLRRPW
eukprot:5250855-Karenia_brevis.AAC.1